jgi:hypothetical protein
MLSSWMEVLSLPRLNVTFTLSVNKDSWKIKELVVDVGLFKKSLNAETLVQNI